MKRVVMLQFTDEEVKALASAIALATIIVTADTLEEKRCVLHIDHLQVPMMLLHLAQLSNAGDSSVDDPRHRVLAALQAAAKPVLTYIRQDSTQSTEVK